MNNGAEMNNGCYIVGKPSGVALGGRTAIGSRVAVESKAGNDKTKNWVRRETLEKVRRETIVRGKAIIRGRAKSEGPLRVGIRDVKMKGDRVFHDCTADTVFF